LKPITIAVDAMSGDKGLFARVLGCTYVLQQIPDIKLTLVGNQEEIAKEANRCNLSMEDGRITIEHVEQIVEMDDDPLFAMRHKKQSSMRVALELLKQDKAQACVSAGNTGALLGLSMYVIKTT